MREVTQDEFYAAIGPVDCHPRLSDDYPYTSTFETRRGRLEVGRIIPEPNRPHRPHYYLPDSEGVLT